MVADILLVGPVWANVDSASICIDDAECGGTTSVGGTMPVVVAGGSRVEGDSTATGGALAVVSSVEVVVMDMNMDSVAISVVKTVEMPRVVLVELLSSPAVLVSDVKVN